MTLKPSASPFAVHLVLLFVCLLVIVKVTVAEDLTGRVVGITDGDPLTLLTKQRQQIRIRLSDIDTPERRQPFSDRAR